MIRTSSKYGNKKCEIYGLKFDSKGERDRFLILLKAQNDRVITNLETQVKFDLCVNGEKICSYIADFVYFKDGIKVVEDFKSNATAKLSTFNIKKKLMKAIYKIEIKVVKKPTDML